MRKILFLLPLILALLVSGTVEAKKKKYPNGDYYEGEMKKGVPHGFGKMTYVNGNTYEGAWKDGKYGFGKMTYANGNTYSGEWKDNMKHGIGKMRYFNGDIYEGEWRIDVISGQGKMITPYTMFEGIWNNGKFVKGKQTHSYGNWREGEWSNGRFANGKCKDLILYSDVDSLYFEGNIKDGRPFEGIGKGKLSNNSYNGKWVNGNFYTGHCTIHNYSDFVSYFSGEKFSNGNYNGTMKLKNGTYIGEINTNFHRQGTGVFKMLKYDLSIKGIWKEDTLTNGKGNFKHNGEICTFNLSKQSDKSYKIIIQEESSIHFTDSRTLNVQNPFFLPDQLAVTILQAITEKKAEEQKAKKERLQKILAQKENNFNIHSYLWSVSNLNSLNEENIVRFRRILSNGKILLYGTITNFFTGEGDNTAAAYWSNGLLPSSYTKYFIRLQGDITIRANSHEIEKLDKGETIFIIAELKKDEDRDDYVFDARYGTITTSLSAMKKKLCSPSGNDLQPKLEYENMGLIKNIYY